MKKRKRKTRRIRLIIKKEKPILRVANGIFRTEYPISALDPGKLPDITPQYIDKSIKNFETKLCCRINTIAIINKKAVCADCFDTLKRSYTGEHWDIRG